MIRPPRTPWERQDEQTPRPSHPRPLGAYTWGKSLQEALVEREAAALGIATRIIRPGALIDFANPELPGLMGRRLFGRWHLGTRPSRPADCGVRRRAMRRSHRVVRDALRRGAAGRQSLRSRVDDAPHADRSPAVAGVERPVCVGPDQRHLLPASVRHASTFALADGRLPEHCALVVDPSPAPLRQPSGPRDVRCDAPRLGGPAICDAAARADAAAPGCGRSVSLRGDAMRVFVTDGDQRPALAITRSLGRRGISVLVGEDTPASLASCSRYCTGTVTYPSPRHARAGVRTSFSSTLVERERIDVVLPVTDVTMHAVSRHAETLRCANGPGRARL